VSDHGSFPDGSSLPPPGGSPQAGGPPSPPLRRPPRPKPTPFWKKRAILPVWIWILAGLVAVLSLFLLTRGGDDAEVSSPATLFPPAPTLPAGVTAAPPEMPVEDELGPDTSPPAAPAPTTASPATEPTTTDTAPATEPAVATSAPSSLPATGESGAGGDAGDAAGTDATEPPATAAVTSTSTTTSSTTTTSTTAPPASTSTTTTSSTTTTTSTTSTTSPSTTTVPLDPDAPRVIAVGTEGPCPFGPDCLLAGFTIENFDRQPTRYVCEFQDGSRYTYRFGTDGVSYACSTRNPRGAITIEVDGVRSNTLTRP
jgi:hypothetical protein